MLFVFEEKRIKKRKKEKNLRAQDCYSLTDFSRDPLLWRLFSSQNEPRQRYIAKSFWQPFFVQKNKTVRQTVENKI